MQSVKFHSAVWLIILHSLKYQLKERIILGKVEEAKALKTTTKQKPHQKKKKGGEGEKKLGN